MPPPAGPSITVVVLAAGEGTRMCSGTAKVLHSFAGRSMLTHVLAAAAAVAPAQVGVVVGHQGEQVVEHLHGVAGQFRDLDIRTIEQRERNGTGHAVRLALQALLPPGLDEAGTVLVLPGDAPLLQGSTIQALLQAHQESDAVATLLTSDVPDPTGYGRVVRSTEDGLVDRVVEHRDADAAQLAITEVSALVYAFDAATLAPALTHLSTNNSQHEEYLPDVVGVLRSQGLPVRALRAPAIETAGVNDQRQLASARRIYNDRLLEAHLRAGVTIVDPASTWVDHGVQIAADATLRPQVELRGATTIATAATIGPQTTLTDTTVGAGSTLDRVVANQAQVGAGVSVGPFAYLRPGTLLSAGVHIGTFVELKNSEVGAGSKVPHLTYVGDASIGHDTNIGAATVFVNYDGVHKHRSLIGNHARTGADTMFVAPVSVGDGAYTAAGSVITDDVPPGSLAVARAPQRNVENWVQRNRAGTASAEAARAAQSDTGRPDDDQQPGEEPSA